MSEEDAITEGIESKYSQALELIQRVLDWGN